MQSSVIDSCQKHKHEVPSVPEPCRWHIAASGIAMLGESPGVAAVEIAGDVALWVFFFPALNFLLNRENLF